MTLQFLTGLPSRSLSRSRKFLGGVGVAVRFLRTLGVRVGVGFFIRIRLRKFNWIILYIALLS